MKKIIFTISILTGFALQAWAYDFQSGDLLYTVNDSNSPEVRLVGHVDGTAALGELVIPETVTYDGVIYKVTVIGKNAFRLCNGLTGNLVIPNSIREIKAGAFYGCTGFYGDLVIPNSVTEINIDNSPDTSVPGAFEGCIGFNGSLVLSNSLEIIGDAQNGGCFAECVNLTGELVIPNTVTFIGGMAFLGCKGLTGTLVIPESVIKINDFAFAGCSGFENVVFPSKPFVSGDYLFAGCTNLTHIDIPEGWMTMGDFIFFNCTGLLSVHLPNSLLEINRSAFEQCLNLKKINLPERLNRIGIGAFASCKRLKELLFPKNLNTIGSWALRRTGLSGEVIVPDSVRRIELYTFDSSVYVTKIVLGNSINYISEPAFRDSRLESMIIRASTPPELSRLANQVNLPFDLPITIPCGTLEAYQNADGWNEFTNIQEGVTDLFSVTSVDVSLGIVSILKEASCEDRSVKVIASPNEGCEFLYWRANGELVSYENPYVFELEEDTELVAYFSGTGVVEKDLLFSISPNPTTGFVTVTGENLQQAEVFNTLGQQVLSVQGSGNEMQINMSAFPAGIYFVAVTNEEGRRCVQKVVRE